ncbi:MAG: Bro-N domain-containing protein [Prevotella sp.]|nr:Bro-N domain-containing protein [Prevotella sp.]
MTQKQIVQLFHERKVRSVWDDKAEKWYFSVVDVVGILTDSPNPQVYWRVLKKRLLSEGNESVTNCNGLKMPAADGKMRMTDVADTEQLLRIIQSVPSPKAEPFKMWLARVGSDRLDQMQDPELGIAQAVSDYRHLGYSDKWIKARLRSIEVRNDLTDEWQRCGVGDAKGFAYLTSVLTKEWSGKTPAEYKAYKGLKKESLRDNMTNIELALNTLAEASTTELSKMQNPSGITGSAKVAKQGGRIAGNARAELEKRLGRSVVSPSKAIDHVVRAELADSSEETT